jgi:hypothetical protein
LRADPRWSLHQSDLQEVAAQRIKEFSDERLLHVAMNKDAARGIATLTRCQAKTICGRVGRALEVGIWKNDQSVFPAEFERE